jgi:signal transduction histidine kinase
MDSSPKPPSPVSLTRRVLRSLNAGSLGVTIGFGLTAAIMLSPVYEVPFTVLLGRVLFVALLLLLVFALTQHWPGKGLPPWMPRWLFTLVAVSLAAPVGTLLVYLISVGGRASDFVTDQPRVIGFFIITFTALLLGLLISLTAQLREREARSHALELELELQKSRLEKQAVDAQLSLLQAQVEPHFLFNTLANVQALVESNSPQAAPVLRSLLAYLRAAMPRLQRDKATLGDELALVRSYLELMQMRMPDRLRFSVEVDPALHGRPFPAMALLTLVENAVRHGIDPSETGGSIEVGGQAGAAGASLWVRDDGVGMGEQSAPGTGLRNLRARLEAYFGQGARLELHDTQPHGLRAEITLPATP